MESLLEASRRRSTPRAPTQAGRAAKPRARSPRRRPRTPRDPNSPHEIERSRRVREANEKLANEAIVPRTRPRVVRFESPPGVVVDQDEQRGSGILSKKTAGSANRSALGHGGPKQLTRDGLISDQGSTTKETWLRLPFSKYKAAACLLAAVTRLASD